ncbi:hypothetical protein BGX33_006224 [Mortierella sp. NVP41]|nr:hypothetical protein BGX33_006224 [Mortierella sp. NVP41]
MTPLPQTSRQVESQASPSIKQFSPGIAAVDGSITASAPLTAHRWYLQESEAASPPTERGLTVTKDNHFVANTNQMAHSLALRS